MAVSLTAASAIGTSKASVQRFGHAVLQRLSAPVSLLQNFANLTFNGAKLIANKGSYGGCVAVQVSCSAA
jgi:hypothetical protein